MVGELNTQPGTAKVKEQGVSGRKTTMTEGISGQSTRVHQHESTCTNCVCVHTVAAAAAVAEVAAAEAAALAAVVKTIMSGKSKQLKDLNKIAEDRNGWRQLFSALCA